jgi:prepilin-type N-terminal cleavage/methylation domain-containing protein
MMQQIYQAGNCGFFMKYGFSLLEVLIAMAVFAIAASASLHCLIISIKTESAARQLIQLCPDIHKITAYTVTGDKPSEIIQTISSQNQVSFVPRETNNTTTNKWLQWTLHPVNYQRYQLHLFVKQSTVNQ